MTRQWTCPLCREITDVDAAAEACEDHHCPAKAAASEQFWRGLERERMEREARQ